MQNKKRKIIMTGGHAASTSYAVISEIQQQKKDWELHFIGGRSSLEGKKVKPLHKVTLKDTDIKYYDLITGRLQRKFTFWTIPSLLKIPIGFLQALILIVKIRPDLVLSFGGYAAFPVVVISWVLRKKIIMHEQTAAAGRANQYLARFADKIAISRESSQKYFPKEKTILTGNPISLKLSKLKIRNKISQTPTIFFTGGASGSVTLNNCVAELLKDLLQKYRVIHQTGSLEYDKFYNLKNDFPDSVKNKYTVKSIIPSQKWPEYINRADVVISRSGANIVAELIQTKKPAVLIPIPFAYLNEQKKNALFAKKIGFVEIIEQKDLTPHTLKKTINLVVENWQKYFNNIKDFESPDVSAAKNVVELMEKYL